MDELAEIVDIQASSDEAMNTLLALPLEHLSGLRTCLFEEARALSLTDPNDVLVNRKGSTLRPKSFVIAEDILTVAVSIQNQQKIPRTTMRNGKRSIQDLSSWRSSQECLTQVENASANA